MERQISYMRACNLSELLFNHKRPRTLAQLQTDTDNFKEVSLKRRLC